MIGLSVLTLAPGELGGTETYVRSLARALARHGTLDYRVFAPPVAPDAGEGLPTEVVPEYRAARGLRARALAMAAAAARPGPIRRRLDAVDAVHYPLTIALPRARAPWAVTLHDVLHRDHPELFGRAEALLRRATYDRPARRARLVLVPSAFAAGRVEATLGIPRERIRVIPHGVDGERFSPPPAGAAREPFLLYPARPWPHKNHGRLLEALELVRAERPDVRLVLTGGGHEGRSYPRGVEVRGLVSDEELVALLRRASALVFPSLYEGFGWPPLEAMACGCPVACSDAGSLPEVVGEAARLFDARDPPAIAAAVLDVLAAPEPWTERGLAQAARFTWRACAGRHEDAYRELLASTRS